MMMHKRIIQSSSATPAPMDVNAAQVAKSDTSFRKPEIKSMMCASSSRRTGPLRRHGAALVFAAACLLIASAIAVASDRLDSSSYDGMTVQRQYGSRSTPVSAPAIRGREMMMMRKTAKRSAIQEAPPPPGLRSFSEGVAEKASAVGELGGGERTMGEMVLDALQSQKQTDAATTTGRMLIKEGDVKGRVPGSKLESTAERIASIVEDPSYGEGGYVADRSADENEYYVYGRRGRGGTSRVQRIVRLNLRVPSGHFQEIVQQIKAMIEEASPSEGESVDHRGKVTSFTTSGRDVTDEFVDTTARADTLDASRKAIQVLLTRADSVEDVMKIQDELNRLTQQSESLRRRALDLKNKSELSVLNVRLEEWKEDGAAYDEDDDDGEQSWSPTKSAYLAWSHVTLLVMYVFDTSAYALVWTVPCVVIYSVGMCVLSKLSSK